jgi:C1A family cysteine protease
LIFQNLWNKSIPVEDQARIAEIYSIVKPKIDALNAEYYAGTIDFLSQMNEILFVEDTSSWRGAIEESDPVYEEGTLQTVDGQDIPVLLPRAKRAVNPPLPQCSNLPAYKNWATEGKTTPVKNQGGCGKCDFDN